MGLSTKEGTHILDRRTKIQNLKEKHKKLFEKEGIGMKAKFVPKMAYVPRDSSEKVVAMFKSELQGGEDVYIEFVTVDYEPDDPERRLYKWPYNAEWETEYRKTEPDEKTGHSRWLIPVDELFVVEDSYVITEKDLSSLEELEFSDLPDANDDAPLRDLTIRDKCAIDWKLPVSRKPWLNKLIKEYF